MIRDTNLLFSSGGSVNLWEHKFAPLYEASVNFFPSMNGVMGLANGQRTSTYLRILTEFVSQDQYKDVVGM